MGIPLRGVNIAGAEVVFQPDAMPVENEDYIWPSSRDFDYLASKGVEFVRITFSWELAQPTLGADLRADGYFGRLLDQVRYATTKGMTVMIEPHGGSRTNFARYKGHAVGSTDVTAEQFADFWTRVEAAVADYDNVVLGLSNEPNDMSTIQWFEAAATAVDAIHKVNNARTILVCGNGFSQPSSWKDSWYDTADTKVANSDAWQQHLIKPNVIASVHTYFDSDGGGSGDDIVNADVIQRRLEPAVAWGRANGVPLHLTEFGLNGTTPGAARAVTNALDYIDANSDVIIGWSWWTYGVPSWWGEYHFTLSPSRNYTVDNPKMSWLQTRFAAPEPTPVIRPWLSTETAPPDRNPHTASVKVGPGRYPNIPPGTYSIRARIRTTYSDADSFCVAVILENPHNSVEIDWQEMTIDVQGHTVVDWWDADINGTTGWVTAKPSDPSRTIGAHNKTSFGLCLKRDTTAAILGNGQIRIKDLRW